MQTSSKFNTTIENILNLEKLPVVLLPWIMGASLECIIKEYPIFIKYLIDQTPELCRIAVKNEGLSITLIRNQTPELCLMAVKQNGLALQYCQYYTYDIRLAAVQQNIEASDHTGIRFDDMDE